MENAMLRQTWRSEKEKKVYIEAKVNRQLTNLINSLLSVVFYLPTSDGLTELKLWIPGFNSGHYCYELSLFLFCLSDCLSVYLSVSLSVCLSLIWVCLYLFFCMYLSGCLSLPVCLSVCLSLFHTFFNFFLQIILKNNIHHPSLSEGYIYLLGNRN